MPKKKYTAEFKTKIVLAIIQGDKEFNMKLSTNLGNLIVYDCEMSCLAGLVIYILVLLIEIGAAMKLRLLFL